MKKVVNTGVKSDVKKGVIQRGHMDGAPRWLTLLFTPPFTGRFTLLFTFKRPFTSE